MIENLLRSFVRDVERSLIYSVVSFKRNLLRFVLRVLFLILGLSAIVIGLIMWFAKYSGGEFLILGLGVVLFVVFLAMK
jgi:hypothetical protein